MKFKINQTKIHPCGSGVISALENGSLCGMNEMRIVNLEEQSEKSARARGEVACRLRRQHAWKRHLISSLTIRY